METGQIEHPQWWAMGNASHLPVNGLMVELFRWASSGTANAVCRLRGKLFAQHIFPVCLCFAAPDMQMDEAKTGELLEARTRASEWWERNCIRFD